MNFVRAPDRRGRRFGQSEILHFACFDEFRHRAYGLLDRSVRVYAVLVIQINVIYAEALQRSITSGAYIFGLAADYPVGRIVLLADVGEFRGQENVVPPLSDGLAD